MIKLSGLPPYRGGRVLPVGYSSMEHLEAVIWKGWIRTRLGGMA